MVVKVTEGQNGNLIFSGKDNNGARIVTATGQGSVSSGVLTGAISLTTDQNLVVAFDINGTTSTLPSKPESTSGDI